MIKSEQFQILKLPRAVESDPRCAAIQGLLSKEVRPIWEKSQLLITQIPLQPNFEKALLRAAAFKHLEPGLEQIEKILRREKKGIQAVQEKQGTAPANRLSRILVFANDGSERFYRDCERLLQHHGERVLGLLVDVPSVRLGMELFGADKQIKAVLVTDRDAVTDVLFSLVS